MDLDSKPYIILVEWSEFFAVFCDEIYNQMLRSSITQG